MSQKPRPLGSALSLVGGALLVLSFFLPAFVEKGCSTTREVYPYEEPLVAPPYAAGLLALAVVGWCYLRLAAKAIKRGVTVIAIVGLTALILWGIFLITIFVSSLIADDGEGGVRGFYARVWLLIITIVWGLVTGWVLRRLRRSTSVFELAGSALVALGSYSLTTFAPFLMALFSVDTRIGLFLSFFGALLVISGGVMFPPPAAVAHERPPDSPSPTP